MARVGGVCSVLALLSLPVLWAASVGPAMVELGRSVDPAQPYLSAADPFLLYAQMPAAVLGACVLVLAPGLLLALALGVRNVGSWVLRGFAWSTLLVSAAAAAAQEVAGPPFVGVGFLVVTAALGVAAAAALAWRVRAGAVPCWPFAPGEGACVLARLAGVPLLFLVVLTPKIFWESFNGDGAHAHEATRLLLWQALPFWPAGIGDELASFPGMKTLAFAYPGSWFMRLFGEGEAAVRLPLLLYLPVLFAGVCAVAGAARPDRLRGTEVSLIWAGIVSFALVMSYSATYNPYCADVGLPATQDALLVACFLGAVHAFLRRETRWMAAFVLLTLMTSPNGLLMLGAWGVGLLVAYRERPWRDMVRFGVVVVLVLAALSVAPALLRSLGLPGPGHEHSSGGLVKKLRYLAPLELGRWAFLIVPAGIYPICGILGWRRADDATRAMWVVVALVFGLFCFMAFVSLHYFVPAMLLPLVAFWMHQRRAAWRVPGVTTAMCVVAAGIALFLGTPRGTGIYTQSRVVGEQMEFRGVPDYQTMEEGWARPVSLLGEVFPRDGEVSVPDPDYGGSPLAWGYYARRRLRREGAPVNYVVAPVTGVPPFGEPPLADDGETAVYVRDPELHREHLAARPLTSVGRALYGIPRDVMFRRRGAVADDMVVIDLGDWWRALVGGE